MQIPDPNHLVLANMSREEQEQFAANMFSVLATQTSLWAEILKESKRVPKNLKDKIVKFETNANILRREVIRPMFGKNIVNLDSMADLVNLILAQQMSEEGLKKLALIRGILVEEKIEILDEKTHFAMPKRQKKQ